MNKFQRKIHHWHGQYELWRVKREQNADVKVFALEGLAGAIMLNLATGFTSMYATRLGADASQIGLISSLPQLMAMLLLIPGSMLAGRCRDARRPVEITALLTGAFYGLGFFVPLLGGMALPVLMLCISSANALLNLYNSSWQNYFSSAVAVSRRNAVYSGRTRNTFMAAAFVVLAAGLVLGKARDEASRILLYRLCYGLAFGFSIWQWTLLRRSPEGERSPGKTRFSDIAAAARTLLQEKVFRRFAAVILLFHAGWYMGWPLFFLSEVKYCGADEAWLSYVTVSGNLLQVATVKFWSRFVERRGPYYGLIAGMLGLVTNPFLVGLSTYLPQPLRMPGLLILNLVSAACFSAFQISLLQCILREIPQERLNLNLALLNTSILAVNAAMQMLGVSFYRLLGENQGAMMLALCTSGAIRILGTLLFLPIARARRS